MCYHLLQRMSETQVSPVEQMKQLEKEIDPCGAPGLGSDSQTMSLRLRGWRILEAVLAFIAALVLGKMLSHLVIIHP